MALRLKGRRNRIDPERGFNPCYKDFESDAVVGSEAKREGIESLPVLP